MRYRNNARWGTALHLGASCGLLLQHVHVTCQATQRICIPLPSNGGRHMRASLLYHLFGQLRQAPIVVIGGDVVVCTISDMISDGVDD